MGGFSNWNNWDNWSNWNNWSNAPTVQLQGQTSGTTTVAGQSAELLPSFYFSETNGGTITSTTFSIANANASDALSIDPTRFNFTQSGNSIYFGSILVATVSGSGASLSLTFDTTTQSYIDWLLESVAYTAVNGAEAGGKYVNVVVYTNAGVTAQATAYVDSLGAVTISGLPSTQTATGESLSPVAGVTVSDGNANSTETLTISVSGAGVLSGAGLSGGQNGPYTLSGSAAAVTARSWRSKKTVQATQPLSSWPRSTTLAAPAPIPLGR